MKRKITRLARAGNCGGFTASGVASAPRALESSPSRYVSASAPNPPPERRRNSRREAGNSTWRFIALTRPSRSIDIEKLTPIQQHVAQIGPRRHPRVGRTGTLRLLVQERHCPAAFERGRRAGVRQPVSGIEPGRVVVWVLFP